MRGSEANDGFESIESPSSLGSLGAPALMLETRASSGTVSVFPNG